MKSTFLQQSRKKINLQSAAAGPHHRLVIERSYLSNQRNLGGVCLLPVPSSLDVPPPPHSEQTRERFFQGFKSLSRKLFTFQI